MMYSHETLSEPVKKIVSDVASYIKSEVGRVRDIDIEEKELNSLVSYVDKTAEKKLVEALSALIPESGFITEEDTKDIVGREWTWVIDPLDGTTNYLHQIPHFSISVALQKEGVTTLGLVHEVMGDEQFFAYLDKGATVNNQPIHVVNTKKLDQILVATGFPYNNDYDIETSFEILKAFLLKTRGMRRMGSAALDLSYVAAGRLGAYYEGSLNKWDLAAGALIVTEAGGSVSDYSGESGYLESGQIIACAPQFYNEIIEILKLHK